MQVSDVSLEHGAYTLLTAEGAKDRVAVKKAKAFLKRLLATFQTDEKEALEPA